MSEGLSYVLSVALGYGGLEPLSTLAVDAFAYSEATRNAGISSSALLRLARESSQFEEMREALRKASDDLVKISEGGATSEEYQRARSKRESAEAAALNLGRELLGGEATSLEVDVASVSQALKPGEIAVAYRRFARWGLKWSESGAPIDSSVESLCVLIVTPWTGQEDVSGRSLLLIDLGPIEPIRAAIEAWLSAIGVDLERGLGSAASARDFISDRGREVRRLALDPVLARAGEASRIVVVPDDVLHLVPLDALPLDVVGYTTGDELVGDRYSIEVRATLGELLDRLPRLSEGRTLLALGGAWFNSEPLPLEAEDVAALEPPGPEIVVPAGDRVGGLLRGTQWERGFRLLPTTGEEARSLQALFDEQFADEASSQVLEKRKASREALTALAPKARYLHVATHGWFAPESIQSWDDPRPLDAQSGIGRRLSGEETIRGMSPMLLSGLALAGANLPENALGRVPGLITADELSTLDLWNCELAVLSACDTARGTLRRAGQGVASLQRAMQMAGARSVIASLWKVPDEATKELMLDFYRRLWVEKKPKSQALWEAKMRLRHAKDERGVPLYTTRDWAAWVLTGDPN